MDLSEVIDINRIKSDIDVRSKKRALEELSNLIAQPETQLGASKIFDSLIARERLGATAVGYGIAIPHGRLKNCNKTTGAFIQLSEGIDFDSIDNQPVDMMFALIVPQESTDEHLQILALLASMFKDEDFRNKLRQTKDVNDIYQLLINWQASEI